MLLVDDLVVANLNRADFGYPIAGRPTAHRLDVDHNVVLLGIEAQVATEILIGAAEGRDFVMHARIGVLRALNRHVERMLTDRKEMHGGKRKLKRDQ
jgi:hypothetical protein